MATTTTPRTISKQVKRKGKKQYTLVTFTFSDDFDEVTLPSFKQIPTGILASLEHGTEHLRKFLNAQSDGLGEIFSEDPELGLDAEETEAFFTAWAEASGTDMGKSEA